jgi:hypothetical protein
MSQPNLSIITYGCSPSDMTILDRYYNILPPAYDTWYKLYLDLKSTFNPELSLYYNHIVDLSTKKIHQYVISPYVLLLNCVWEMEKAMIDIDSAITSPMPIIDVGSIIGIVRKYHGTK